MAVGDISVVRDNSFYMETTTGYMWLPSNKKDEQVEAMLHDNTFDTSDYAVVVTKEELVKLLCEIASRKEIDTGYLG